MNIKRGERVIPKLS